MKRLTRQEQIFIGVVAGLLLAGLLVKFYRTAHPVVPAAVEARN